MAIGDYSYLRLEAKWDSVSQRHCSVRTKAAVAAVILISTLGLFVLLFAPERPTDAPLHASAPSPLPTIHSSSEWDDRASRVKQAYLHAYSGWERYASPHDELLPLTNKSVDNFNGWGVTLFDSLDTMLLMGLNDEFNRAIHLVESTTFSMDSRNHAQFFETVIRYLGGLLSAYALSNEPILLMKADELGHALSPAFKTRSGLPRWGVNPTTGSTTGSSVGGLAEVASCQMEYMYLAQVTGKREHYDKASTVIRRLAEANIAHLDGMLPTYFDLNSGKGYNTQLTVGAAGDSGHEYLLKQYLQTAKTDITSLKMYLRMTMHVIANLMYLSPDRKLLYVTDSNGEDFRPSHRFEHLSCFFPGLLALGARTLPLEYIQSVGIDMDALAYDLPERARAQYALLSRYSLRDLHLWAAEGMAETCWLTYADSRSGLAPDESNMRVNSDTTPWIDALEQWRVAGKTGPPPGTETKRPRRHGEQRDYQVTKSAYLLRPESVESFYLLWRATGDIRWRDRGWKVFQAIEKWSRTPSGYAAIRDVDAERPEQMDAMQSFYLAETLKYLFLLFTDDDLVPLDKWVFNTEAHPLPVFEWTTAQMQYFGVHNP